MERRTFANLEMGKGMPRICVSLMAADFALVLDAYERCKNEAADLFEWRLDYLLGDAFGDTERLDATLEELARREAALRGEKARAFILSLRTEYEGGRAALSPREYREYIHSYITHSRAEVLDIEAFNQEEGLQRDVMEFLVDMAHENGKQVILSNHDLMGTPDRGEILHRLRILDSLGADLPKVAYMAQSREDSLRLLAAAKEAEESLQRPFIALSLGKEGSPSRICAGEFGSCISYAPFPEGEAAEGQLPVNALHYYLRRYYEEA